MGGFCLTEQKCETLLRLVLTKDVISGILGQKPIQILVTFSSYMGQQSYVTLEF